MAHVILFKYVLFVNFVKLPVIFLVNNIISNSFWIIITVSGTFHTQML